MPPSTVPFLAALAAVAACSIAGARHIAPLGTASRTLARARGLSTVLDDWLDAAGLGDDEEEEEVAGCSEDALKFIDLLNEYRAEKGEDPITASPSLCIVSNTHVKDLQNNHPDDGSCGMHSWSDEGTWSSCCFPDTNGDAEPSEDEMRCSWDKPRELTQYSATGYENTLFDGAAEDDASPWSALENWKNSDSHHMLMINGGNWEDNKFKAVGAGFRGKYAVMWVGEDVDPLDDGR